MIIDWSGIIKADIGVKNGRIVGVGKAGNPDTMDGVTEGMIVGSSTEVGGRLQSPLSELANLEVEHVSYRLSPARN
jgi:urease alpha subunit